MKNPTAKKIVFSLVSGGLLGIAMSATPVMASSMGSPCAGKMSMGQKANPCAAKKNPCAAKMGSKKMANPCAAKKNPCAGKMNSQQKPGPCAGKPH